MIDTNTLNPYLERTPVADPANFHGRTADVRWVLERITAPRPQCCSITGLPRIGKTSLLRFIAHPEGARGRAPGFFRDLAPLLIVYVDLALVSVAPGTRPSSEAVVRHLMRAIHREVRCQGLADDPDLTVLDQYAARARSASDWPEVRELFTDYVYTLDGGGYRLVLLLDELDSTTAWDPQMAYFLRSLVMQTNTAYVTASLEPLFELLDEHGRVSPLYNIFSTHALGLLPPEEARELLCAPAARVGVTWPPGLVEQVLSLTGRHPDLVKMAGSAMWELHTKGELLTLEAIAARVRPDADGLFRSIWRHVSEGEREALGVLVSDGVHSLAALAALPRLQSRALTVDQNGGTAPFGTLFTGWLRERVRQARDQADLQLDGRWVTVEGQRIQLTPTEARLATYLFERRGQTCNRADLIQAIWGDEELKPDSKVLDTTVQRLREKIERDRANPDWLITVRGEGYTLRE
ncbi:MAG: winged helix-turn-helix domain-containing protein [Ardenticatenaceae bacterium]|nr:winged helix-turn-helix domain-containing protein [Ardenticatenaceae bacterium]